MKQVKRISAMFLALMMVLSLCACGSSRGSSGTQSYTTAAGEANYSSSAYYADDFELDEAAVPMVADYDAGLGMTALAAAKTGSGGSADTPENEDAAENPDKIIYSSDVTVETTQFD